MFSCLMHLSCVRKKSFWKIKKRKKKRATEKQKWWKFEVKAWKFGCVCGGNMNESSPNRQKLKFLLHCYLQATTYAKFDHSLIVYEMQMPHSYKKAINKFFVTKNVEFMQLAYIYVTNFQKHFFKWIGCTNIYNFLVNWNTNQSSKIVISSVTNKCPNTQTQIHNYPKYTNHKPT